MKVKRDFLLPETIRKMRRPRQSPFLVMSPALPGRGMNRAQLDAIDYSPSWERRRSQDL
jgi:hypothetical protein